MTLDFLPDYLLPFEGFDAFSIALLVLIYLLTSSLRGALGFGTVAPAIIFASMVTTPHHAVLLTLTVGTMTQIQFVPDGLRDGDWKVTRPLIAAIVVSIFFGLFAFRALDPGWLTVLLALVMAGITVLTRYKVLERLARRIDLRDRRIAFGLATGAGLMASVAGAGGMYLLAAYARLACPNPASMRGTLILIGSVMLYWRFAAAVMIGLIDLRLIVESVLMLPAIVAGGWAGTRFFRHADAKRFYNAFEAVLMLGVAALLWKGLSQVM